MIIETVITLNTPGTYRTTLLVRTSFIEVNILLRTPFGFPLRVICTPFINSNKLPSEVLNGIERLAKAIHLEGKQPNLIKFDMVFQGVVRFCKISEQTAALEGVHLFIADIDEIHSVEELSA